MPARNKRDGKITGFINAQIKGKTDLICRIRIDAFILAEPFSNITGWRDVCSLKFILQVVCFFIDVICITGKPFANRKEVMAWPKLLKAAAIARSFSSYWSSSGDSTSDILVSISVY